MPFTLRNIKEDLEDVGSRFDGAPDLEFRLATEALELEKSGLSYQRVRRLSLSYGTRTRAGGGVRGVRKKKSTRRTWSSAWRPRRSSSRNPA